MIVLPEPVRSDEGYYYDMGFHTGFGAVYELSNRGIIYEEIVDEEGKPLTQMTPKVKMGFI